MRAPIGARRTPSDVPSSSSLERHQGSPSAKITDAMITHFGQGDGSWQRTL